MLRTLARRQTRWMGIAIVGWLASGLVASAEAQVDGRSSNRTARSMRSTAAPSGVAPASATSTSVAGGRQQIDSIYRMASQAKSVGKSKSALTECDRLAATGLDAENDRYLRRLRGWLLNRRGEAYALSATQAMEDGNDRDAQQRELQAVADYTASIESDPQWRAYHNRGVSRAMLGEYDDALADFSAAIKLKPDYPNTRFNRAELLLEREAYAEAEREYTSVLELDPNDADSLIGRGHARFYLANFDGALEDFDEVIRRQPENAVAYADRADLYAYLGKWEFSAQDYRMAVKLDQTLGRAYQSAAWLMSTCPDDNFRDEALALRAAKRAIDLDGQQDYRYLDTLAAAHANARQYPDALKAIQAAMKVAPDAVRPELKDRMTLYQAQRPFRDTAVR
ncbi:MAG: tetratricopeptide repeat protein [Planctomycetales bacterium]|nr:tetratricopeptide repeat protein [Planctomycetales bacterium]